ncbi:DUF2017 family protein [Microbacterium sp. Mu-80]|uniref:DUF2017 family protein n=1 Tax=Microbacterium bandirmense TaxID=3122050 RepID=A0ABU8LAB6_9MICO
MSADLRLSVSMIEGQNLLRLIDEFIDLLVDGRDTTDAGLDRLTPTPYPEDEAAAEDFRSATRIDLLDRRVSDALEVRSALSAFDLDDVEPGTEAAIAPHDVVIPIEDTDSWLRTLSAIRLVVAARLGIDTSDPHDPRDARFHVYDWLAYRLDQIVLIADERDAMGDGANPS